MGIGITMLVVIGGSMAIFAAIFLIGFLLWMSYEMYKTEEFIMAIVIMVILILMILVTIALTLVYLEV
jgi:hypothetical protein